MSMRSNVIPILASLLVSFAGPASAEPEINEPATLDHNQIRALQHFERGRAFFMLQDYERAAQEYLKAHELVGKALLLYNAAQAFRLHGDKTMALKYYEQYVADEPDGRGVDNAKTLAAELRAALAREPASIPASRPLGVPTEPTAPDATPGKPPVELPGAPSPIDIKPVTMGSLVDPSRMFNRFEERPPEPVEWRWPRWIPWTVIGTGSAITLSGLAWQWRSSVNFAAFDARADALCIPPGGCPPGFSVSQHDQAQSQQNIAFGSYAAGATIALTGVALLYLNNPKHKPDRDFYSSVQVVPQISPESSGLLLGLTF